MTVARCIHRGFHLISNPTLTEDGQYQARVAIVALDGERTTQQHFLDLDTFADERQANECAVMRGKYWVDRQIRQEQLRLPTGYAAIR